MRNFASAGLKMLMVFGLLLLLVSTAHAAPGDYLREWGAKYHFLGPWGVATDRQGNVYVPDSGGNRIQKLTNSGRFVTSWGTKGSGDGQFLNPMSVARGPASSSIRWA